MSTINKQLLGTLESNSSTVTAGKEGERIIGISQYTFLTTFCIFSVLIFILHF